MRGRSPKLRTSRLVVCAPSLLGFPNMGNAAHVVGRTSRWGCRLGLVLLDPLFARRDQPDPGANRPTWTLAAPSKTHRKLSGEGAGLQTRRAQGAPRGRLPHPACPTTPFSSLLVARRPILTGLESCPTPGASPKFP